MFWWLVAERGTARACDVDVFSLGISHGAFVSEPLFVFLFLWERRRRGLCAKAPAVETFAWLPVGVVSTKAGCGSVSSILAGFQVVLFFGRSTLPRKWGTNIDKTGFSPGVGDLAPKARKTFFYESLESESAFFCISQPPGHLCGPYFKVTARTNNGNPAVLFSQCYKPHLANWQKNVPA